MNITEFLTKRGYKAEIPPRCAPEYVQGRYYRTDRTKNVPDCLLNDKPPQFMIDHSKFENHVGQFSIEISNQSPQGWIDFKYYSLSEDELRKGIDEMEDRLLEAWTTLFKPAQEIER